jgi:hypothetical protein
MQTVLVTVSGGVAEVAYAPSGVKVVVVDFDGLDHHCDEEIAEYRLDILQSSLPPRHPGVIRVIQDLDALAEDLDELTEESE